MKALIMLLAIGFSGLIHAELGAIQCQAEYRIITNDGIKDAVVKPMVMTYQDSRAIRFEADVEGRSFTLSGDPSTGDFMLSQVWGKGYSEGINSTGNFNSVGRLQISTIDSQKWFDPNDKNLPREKQRFPDGLLGSRIYKLVCNKTLASQFPNQ